MVRTLIYNVEKFCGCIKIKNGLLMSLIDDVGNCVELVIPDELRLTMSIGFDNPN